MQRHSNHLKCNWISRYGQDTVYPKKYAHGFCFAVLCCGYTLTDFPISIRLTSLALWQSNDCPSASKATLMNMDKYFMWSHYERLHNHNKAKQNKTVCIFLGIYCTPQTWVTIPGELSKWIFVILRHHRISDTNHAPGWGMLFRSVKIKYDENTTKMQLKIKNTPYYAQLTPLCSRVTCYIAYWAIHNRDKTVYHTVILYG